MEKNILLKFIMKRRPITINREKSKSKSKKN